MVNELLLTLLFVGLVAVYFWRRRIEGADASALFWATVSEPLVYIQEDIDDHTVGQRAERARAKLVEHGNKYLVSADVWVYIWRATEVTGMTADFSIWRAMAMQHAVKKREEWAKEKAGYNPAATAERLSNQKPFEWTS